MSLIRSLDTRPLRGLLGLPTEFPSQILSNILIDYDTQGTRHAQAYFTKTHWLTVNDGTFKPP